jgi:hypothetical protein
MNFKKMVEARMAKTGESWSTAAGHVRAAGKGDAESPAAPKPFVSEPFAYDGTAEPADGGGFFLFDGSSPNAMGPFLDRGGDVGAAEMILDAHLRGTRPDRVHGGISSRGPQRRAVFPPLRPGHLRALVDCRSALPDGAAESERVRSELVLLGVGLRRMLVRVRPRSAVLSTERRAGRSDVPSGHRRWQ